MPDKGVAEEHQDDRFDDLQQQVLKGMGKTYTPVVMALWKDPQNAGSLDYPDGYGQVTGPCGDTMQIWLRVRNDVIIDAKFWTDGCGPSIVCGSIITIMVKGKSLEAAVRIDQDSVLDELGGLPEESHHCALLAADALGAAIGCVRSELVAEKTKEVKHADI